MSIFKLIHLHSMKYTQLIAMGFEISGLIIGALLLGNFIGKSLPDYEALITVILIIMAFISWLIRIIRVSSKK